MIFAPLTRLIESLQAQARRLQDESERRLVQAACSGTAITFSVAIGFGCYLIWPTIGALILGATLASGVLIPLSLLCASLIWERTLASWVVSGDIFKRLRYFDYWYFREIDRIKRSPFPAEKKKGLYLKANQEYLEMTEPLRDIVGTLNNPSQRNLLK